MTVLLADAQAVPWWGIAAVVAMFVLPILPRGFWEGRPFQRRPRPPRQPYPSTFSLPPRQPWGQGHSRTRAVPRRPRAAMPARSHLSTEYRTYMDGRPPVRDDGRLHPAWDGVLWPDRSTYVLQYNRDHNGGHCLLGLVCGLQAQATECDHTDYSELFHETMRTLKPVCHDCHVRREQLKDQDVDAWKWRVNQ